MHDAEQYILENIRNLRRAKGIKSSALANNLGISQGEYSKIENGHRSDYHSYLPQIAQSLGVDFHELISPPPRKIRIRHTHKQTKQKM